MSMAKTKKWRKRKKNKAREENVEVFFSRSKKHHQKWCMLFSFLQNKYRRSTQHKLRSNGPKRFAVFFLHFTFEFSIYGCLLCAFTQLIRMFGILFSRLINVRLVSIFSSVVFVFASCTSVGECECECGCAVATVSDWFLLLRFENK